MKRGKAIDVLPVLVTGLGADAIHFVAQSPRAPSILSLPIAQTLGEALVEIAHEQGRLSLVSQVCEIVFLVDKPQHDPGFELCRILVQIRELDNWSRTGDPEVQQRRVTLPDESGEAPIRSDAIPMRERITDDGDIDTRCAPDSGWVAKSMLVALIVEPVAVLIAEDRGPAADRAENRDFGVTDCHLRAQRSVLLRDEQVMGKHERDGIDAFGAHVDHHLR